MTFIYNQFPWLCCRKAFLQYDASTINVPQEDEEDGVSTAMFRFHQTVFSLEWDIKFCSHLTRIPFPAFIGYKKL